MKLMRPIGGMALIVLAGVLLALTFFRMVYPRPVPAMRAVRRELVQTVVASGRIRPPARVRLGAQSAGRVTKVLVREGETVTSGQALILLDDAEARAAVDQAQAGLDQVTRVRDLISEATLAQAEAALRRAEADFARVHGLFTEGIASGDQLEQYRAALEVARSQERIAHAQAEGTASVEKRMARASLAATQARLRQARITAPGAGIILTRSVEAGDVVQAGRILMEMALAGSSQIQAEPDERSLALLRPGQPAMATADAFPDHRFACRVASVSPSVDPQRGTVEVRLDVDDPPPFLQPDMTASVEIEVARQPNALAVPVEAVREPLSPSPWVLVIRAGHAEKRPVKLGVRGERLVDIAQGVVEGEVIAVVGRRGLEPGERVRASLSE